MDETEKTRTVNMNFGYKARNIETINMNMAHKTINYSNNNNNNNKTYSGKKNK